MAKKILVLGASGMLGHIVLRKLSHLYQVWGTMRSTKEMHPVFPLKYQKKIITNVDALQIHTVRNVILDLKPYVVINCIGIIKQLKEAQDTALSIRINSLFPLQLEKICSENAVRMIHYSTDCVFDGMKGNYIENDNANATDIYGRAKFLGEIRDSQNVLTLRTSIIGHELKSRFSLLEWFLAQEKIVKGFTNAIYTGLTTIEISKIISEKVIPNTELHGTYQLASAPINKCQLLNLVKEIYNKNIEIQPDDSFFCDRSMLGKKFATRTNYQSPSWRTLITEMQKDWMLAKKEGFYV